MPFRLFAAVLPGFSARLALADLAADQIVDALRKPANSSSSIADVVEVVTGFFREVISRRPGWSCGGTVSGCGKSG